jgi:hypothetical protein
VPGGVGGARPAAPPAQPAPACNGLAWSFAGEHTLQRWETVSTTLTARVDAALSASVEETALASLPYSTGGQAAALSARAPLVVDAEDPQVAVVAPPDGALLGGGSSAYVIGGSASDDSSWVTRVELVDLPLAGGVETVTAEGTGPWAYTWELPADGTYTLRARAYDQVGHASPDDTATVTVDNTAPTVTLDLSEGQFVTGQVAKVITITLSGSASDNLSGLARVQVSTDGRPWREVWAEGDAPLSAGWSTAWTLPSEVSAQGQHTVAARAFDRAGNESETLQRTIVVDVLPPTDESTNRTYLENPPHVPVGQPLTLHGVANDAGRVPPPPRPAELLGTLDSLGEATIWLELASVGDNDAGVSVTWLGDLNGDRLADLALGLPAAADGAGRVTLLYGRAGGWPVPPNGAALAQSPSSFLGLPGAGLGAALAAAGDVDGDGLSDLLIGDPASNRVFLVFGRPSAIGPDTLLDGPQTARWSEIIPPLGEAIGERLGAAGDVDGDGYDDLLIGATGAEDKAYLLLGQPRPWWDTVPLDPYAAAEIATGPAGARLSGVGDMDGDGRDEFVVVVGTTVYLFAGQGSYTAHAGASLNLTDDAIASFESTTSLPAVAALGDVDGDGLTDFAFANGDTPRLVFGDADRNWTSHDLTFWPAPSGFLAAPGDVDADGRADLLLGNADGDAYLLLGADLDQVAATLTGVAAAASVPYAAGGDLNSDGSSDLLLVPAETAAAQMGMYSLGYGQTPYVDPASLPVAVTHAPAALSGDGPALVRSQVQGMEADASQAVTHTVDDDGCPGCITTLAAAVEQAGAGDTIIVQPGVYERLEIGPGKDYLTVQGVDADAVFVDGGGGLYAAHVSGTVGVRLANLTLRNAQRAVWLENAGGYEHPEDATALDHLLIHAFSEHALYMDRASSVALSRCTLVGGGASSSRHIQVYGPPDPALEASWSTVFTGTLAATGAGGGVHPSDRGVYVLPGGGSDALYRYDPLPSAWYTITVPFAVSAVGGAAATSDGSLHFLHPDAWTGPAGGGRFGQSVSTAGDVNGDGYGDVIVGAPDRSSAYLYLGSSTGLSAEPAWSATGSGVGWDVGTAGDVNGDGYDDVLVVEYNSERAHVYLGGDSGLSPTPVATLSGENSGEEFGSSASAAGDVNGDGYDDIIVGAKAYDTYTGRAYLYLGDTDGISTTAPITLSGENPYDWFGDAVGTAGDVNGDGYDDVLVGARKAADMTGRAYLYLGGASGPAPTPIVLAGDSYFGSSVDTAGDVNGDGYADVTVAELRPARAHVYLGGESGLNTTAVATLLSGDSEQFCYSAGTAGDVNGDGYADVIVGQVPASQGAGYGQTYVYLGDTRGISNTAPTLLAGYSPDKWFGLSVGGAGDVNGDGYDDVIVGDAGYSDNAGRVYYHLGGQGGLSNTLCTAGKYLYLCPGCVSPFRHSRYSIHEDAWSERSPLPEYVDPADIAISLTRDGSDRLCALAGGSLQSLYCYDVVDDAWSLNRNQEARPPFTVSVDTATVWADGALYVLAGESSEFWRYDPGNSALWEPLQSVAVTVAAGASLAWDGGEWIYALVGGNSKQFLRYHVPTDQWQVLGDGSTLTPDDDDTPIGINAGGGLALFGQGLYAVPGGDVGALWRYSPVGVTPDKLALDRVAFVVPETAAAPTWLNPDLPAEDFALSGSGNAWVAGSGTAWSPSPSLEDSRLMAHDEARFLDADRGVYRLGADSILDAGYHIYRPDAIVAAGGGEEFTSIQAAVHSGANRVLVRPGVYPEPFYLVSGVEVIGACADKTLIELPGGSSAPALVRAEGVVRAGLSRLTLAGDGVVDGLHVEDGARFIVVARDIVRGAGAGIRVEGPEADVEVVNNTLVGNVSGLVAANCASVDVRNTILAYHGSAGLQYEPCAGTKLHSYNLYWANGVDVDDGTSDPAAGAGERFLDPLFVDVPGDDYRTVAESPAIDAGDPTDPAPPGAGSRVDIGYLEQGRAAFYADDDYCEFCANDGLTWQVDAFDTIQDALDVAADELSVLAWPDRPPRYTVGVGPGLYSEAITLPSHLRLVGAATLGGAEETVLDAGGRETAVTLDGVVQAELSGLTIMGASSAGVAVLGASNAITVSRNIIAGNPNGVALSGRATGLVAFNTLADNSGDGILCSGHGTWALVANNILADNGTGLHTRDGGQMWNDYNLLDNTSNYVDEAGTGLTRGPNELVDLDPLFETGSYRLRPTSPAVDAASPFAPVPPGGGARADMGYREVLATPLTLLLGRQGVSTAMGNSGVQEVQVGITPLANPGQPVTETLPAAWSAVELASPGNTVSYWQTGFTPGDEGLYRLYSRATDVVGNRESDEEAWYDGAWVADGSPPDVTWLSPPGGSILTAPLELRAEVSDYPGGHFGVREIHFEVDGTPHAAQWAVEPWDPASGQPRVFRAWISAPVGIHDVIAVAEDRAGHVGQSAPVNLTVSGYAEADTTPPTLAVSSPAPGSWVTHTVVWSGTAGDGESGLASVEVSMDGGTTWRPADVSGADWSLPWITPLGQEYVSYPARVRARDRAGNATVDARVVTVDNLAPSGLYPVTFSAPQGTHLDARTPLTIAWNAPLDGSGSAFVLLAADQVSDTIPAEQAPGTGATVELGASGQWYVHLATRDQAGNQLTRHYGPWHVGTFDDPDLPFAGREQSIVIDGYLDLANDEWRDDREFLDDDERPRERQSLYVTWDGQAFYLAWQGAWWTLDGGLWAYLDLESGGTDQPLAGGRVLPFEADRAVSVDGAQGGTLWTYSGGAWRPGPLEFAHGDSGGTELRLPLDNSQVEDLRLIAFALDHDGVPWSVFPTTNPLPGPWPDAYHWVNPSVVSSPGAGQLRGTSVQMALSSPQAPQAAWGPGSALAYVVDLANGEAHEVEGLALTFHASEGLAYQAVAGATCADCTAGDAWRLDVPSLPAGAGHRITVTGQLASSLDDLRAVTSTVTLELESAALDQAALSHRVDGQPPTVTVGIAAGQLLGPGLQTIHGTASDGDGIGVAAVEVRPASSADWQTANGTRFWSIDVSVPADATTWPLEARARDLYGQIGQVTVEFIVDATPPTVTLDLPPYLAGNYAKIGGTTADRPPPGRVDGVDVQLDQDTALWQPALVVSPDATGLQNWHLIWDLPLQDGVTHTLRVRASDAAGNVSLASGWQSTVVDNVAPLVTVTHVLSEVEWADYGPGGTPDGPVISGTVSDGSGVSAVRVRLDTPTGSSYEEAAEHQGGAWSYTPILEGPGLHRLYVRATDAAGNVSVRGPFDLLAAASLSPTLRGSVGMQGRRTKPDPSWAIPLTVWLAAADGGTPACSFTTTTDQEGKFELLLEGITPGRYDISVKGNHTLRNLARDVELAAGDNDTYMGTLLEGDAETVFTFNRVGLADAFTLLRSFGRCRGHPRFIANADLDESDCVWIPDFGLLARNFGKKGDVVVRAATSLPPEPPPEEGDGALLAFQRERMTVEVNETVTLTLAIDPRGEPVNGGAVDLRFDPALIEVVDVSLSDHLPFVLEEPLVDNQEGVVRFSAGVLDQALSEPFSIATLSLRVKEDTTGTTITFTDAFSATDVSGPTGSVLTEARGITLGTFKNHVYLPAITR